MRSVKIPLLVLFTLLGLALTQPCISQTLTNTGNVITLSGTCMNSRLSTATYTLTLYYIDPDNGPIHPAPVRVSVVVVNSTTATITLPSSTLPTPATKGYWLSDADQGSIILSGNAGGGPIIWAHDLNGNIQFNCDPLAIYIIRGNSHGILAATHFM